ncbi:MAG: phage holin family protein [Verrucomicrobiota bacterium]
MDASSSGLRRAVHVFLGHLTEALALRGRLAALEFREERGRLVALLAWLAAGILGAFFALLFFSLAVILIFWESHPLLATLGVAVAYLFLLAIAGWRLLRIVRRSPAPFERSLQVLRDDSTWLFPKD